MTDVPNDLPTQEASAEEPTRAPAPEPEAPAAPIAPVTIQHPTRRTRPVLGPALMVAGIALWAFVVFGTYTTSWLPGGDTPLNGTLAVVVAAIITMRAWVVCVRRDSPDPFAGPHGMIGRYVSVGVVAFGFWTFAVSFATFVGRTSPANLDIFIAGALLLVSALSLVAGHRMTGRAPSKRSSARRLFVLAGWFAAGLMTLGSCVELVAEH